MIAQYILKFNQYQYPNPILRTMSSKINILTCKKNNSLISTIYKVTIFILKLCFHNTTNLIPIVFYSQTKYNCNIHIWSNPLPLKASLLFKVFYLTTYPQFIFYLISLLYIFLKFCSDTTPIIRLISSFLSNMSIVGTPKILYFKPYSGYLSKSNL